MNEPPAYIRRGTPEYTRAGAALFLGGFATFSLIYCVQPLLPLFADTFTVSPAESSLALSLTTGTLAISILVAVAFSQVLGRRGVMFASMLLAAILNIAAAVVPQWQGLLVARALEGVVLGGVPAVAMAYLAEEIEPAHLGRTMGLYVAGTAFGGMTGRVGVGLLSEFMAWQSALVLLGVLCVAAAVGFRMLLPPSRNFVAQTGFDLGYHLRVWGEHLSNAALWRVYLTGFLLMSVLVTIFNYVSFRLIAPPYELPQATISLLFLVYGFGIAASSVAGGLADRFGRRTLMMAGMIAMLAGIALTLLQPLAAVFAGIVLITAGFFGSHAVASGAVGPLAATGKGHAAALYLLFYYMGLSISGTFGGWFWSHGGWPSVAALTGVLTLMGLALAVTAPGPPRPTQPPNIPA